jgi:hypothetical protein
VFLLLLVGLLILSSIFAAFRSPGNSFFLFAAKKIRLTLMVPHCAHLDATVHIPRLVTLCVNSLNLLFIHLVPCGPTTTSCSCVMVRPHHAANRVLLLYKPIKRKQFFPRCDAVLNDSKLNLLVRNEGVFQEKIFRNKNIIPIFHFRVF